MSGNQPANPYGPPDPNQANEPAYGQDPDSWTPPSQSQPSGIPQFGQRSENWTPQETNPAGPQEPSTPWPVYGQNGNPAGSPNVPPQQQGYGQQVPPQYGAPTPYPGSPYQGQYSAPVGPMPSRTAPILTLVAGLILMFVVAPVVFISAALGSVGLDKMVDGSIQTPNGGTTVVNSAGILAVTPLTGDATGCSIEDESGTVTQLYYEAESGGTYVGRQIPEGTYTITCEGVPTGAELMVMDGEFLSTIVSGSVKALGWASLIGLAGLITAVVGIVWLVKRNGQRRAHMQNRAY